ncbi:hypothetical protein G6F23_013976 [Rhizopus arrhizus]|nr:hypothetical protein G6F23_013976 [Rhizopus arrhizus]
MFLTRAAVAGQRGGTDLGALCRRIAGVVAGTHAVAVGGRCGQPAIDIAGAGRRADQAAVAVHVIAGHAAAAGVVGGRAPAERDAVGGTGADCQPARHARRGGVAPGRVDGDGDGGRAGGGIVVVGGHRTQRVAAGAGIGPAGRIRRVGGDAQRAAVAEELDLGDAAVRIAGVGGHVHRAAGAEGGTAPRLV